MVLADEELVVVERVGEMDQTDVAFEGKRRILPRVVDGHHEKRELHRARPRLVGVAIILAIAPGRRNAFPAGRLHMADGVRAS